MLVNIQKGISPKNQSPEIVLYIGIAGDELWVMSPQDCGKQEGVTLRSKYVGLVKPLALVDTLLTDKVIHSMRYWFIFFNRYTSTDFVELLLICKHLLSGKTKKQKNKPCKSHVQNGKWKHTQKQSICNKFKINNNKKTDVNPIKYASKVFILVSCW